MRDSAYAIGIILNTVRNVDDKITAKQRQAVSSDTNLLSFKANMVASFLLLFILLASAAMTIGAESFFSSDENSTTVFATENDSDDGLVSLIKTWLANASLISHMLPVTIFAALDILYTF